MLPSIVVDMVVFGGVDFLATHFTNVIAIVVGEDRAKVFLDFLDAFTDEVCVDELIHHPKKH